MICTSVPGCEGVVTEFILVEENHYEAICSACLKYAKQEGYQIEVTRQEYEASLVIES